MHVIQREDSFFWRHWSQSSIPTKCTTCKTLTTLEVEGNNNCPTVRLLIILHRLSLTKGWQWPEKKRTVHVSLHAQSRTLVSSTFTIKINPGPERHH